MGSLVDVESEPSAPSDSSAPRTWSTQPGVRPETAHEHIPSYVCDNLRARSPECLQHILPTLNQETDIDEIFSQLPLTDYIILAMRFEELCMTKIGTYPDETEYRYKPLTEVGLAQLDMRDVIRGRGRGTPPGDRGSSWFRLMKPTHYIVEEYRDHWGHICQTDWQNTESYFFAFGKSREIPESDVASRLGSMFEELRKRNRTPREKASKTLRRIMVLAFDATPVEMTLHRLGIPWLAQEGVHMVDLQRDMQLELRFSWPRMRFKYVLEALGLRFEDGRFGNLSHCAGNAAVFAVQALLALFYKDAEQAAAFSARMPVAWLRYTWVGYTLDQHNIAPGGEARRRGEGEMNRDDVPQRKEDNAFY